MRTRSLAPILIVLLGAGPARAAVVVIGNYTSVPIEFTVAEPDAKPRAHTLESNHVVPVSVTGPAVLTFTPPKGKPTALHLEPYTAYVFLPDRTETIRLEGMEMPGKPLERDARPELNPVPRTPPVKVPVTLLVDDAELRAEKIWQKDLRERFDEAAEAIEKATGIRLVLDGFDTWKSDPDAKNTMDLLTGLETAVKPKPGGLVVGYSSRAFDPKVDPTFGANRGLGGRRVLLREGWPRKEPQRVEVLAHFLAQALGAVGTPDPGSAMRSKLDDDYILRAGAVLRLDPLNALALNIWAEERRREPDVAIATLSPANRHRLTRVYKALLHAAPGDPLALAYLEDLDREVGKGPEPAVKNPDRPPVKLDARDEHVRLIVLAVAARAKANAQLGAAGLTGDDLTAAYVRTAAEAALTRAGPEMVSAFLVALGIALDDTDALIDDGTTSAAVLNAETKSERKARIAALGNPTLGGRRDLCRRFFVGCATGELLPSAVAEKVAVGRAVFDLHRPTGMCVPALAAEFAGIAFAGLVQNDPETVRDVVQKFAAADYLPPLARLRNGLSVEKFEEVYGDPADERFAAVLADIRNRLSTMKAYKRGR
jgi:hypothetical protein